MLQTIQMLRLAHVRKTRRGPGYQNPDNEIYWIQEELREEPRQPYQIWLIASVCSCSCNLGKVFNNSSKSCATNVAVGRSIRRGILDGRWSSLSELLRSHKLFSTNFELYSKHVDLVMRGKRFGKKKLIKTKGYFVRKHSFSSFGKSTSDASKTRTRG